MSRRRWFQVFITTIVTAILLILPGTTSAQGNSDNAFERVKEVQERHTGALMATEGVVGTAIGHDEAGEYAVLVFLERPGVAGIPDALEGVPLRAQVSGRIQALPKPPVSERGKPTPPANEPPIWGRPNHIGVSTGHPNITAGTIGCRVIKGGTLYLLSNNHVYANENKASIGDDVLMPGPYDGGKDPRDKIGTLNDFVPIVFGPRGRNTVDAAIALLDLLSNGEPAVSKYTPDPEYPADLTKNGYAPSTNYIQIDSASIGLPVKKYGRTTGLSTGTISAINGNFTIWYSKGYAYFVGQIVVGQAGFSSGGDSGSLIVTQGANNPVGLLFAGSSTMTIANPIGAVLDALHVTIDGQ